MQTTPPRKYAFEGIVATILFIALIICMLLQISARAGLTQPPIWTEELSRWLWVWMAFFGMAEVERRNEHLVVDFFAATSQLAQTTLRAILGKGLEATEPLWPDVRVAFGWVYRAAVILRNRTGLDAAGMRRRYRGLIAAIAGSLKLVA